MEIYNLYPGSWGSNCYILISGGAEQQRTDHTPTLHAAVIDPSADADTLIRFIKEKNAVLDYIVLTHGHFDHMTFLDELRDKTNAPAYIHKRDAEMLTDGEKNAYSFFFGFDKRWRPAECLLENGDKLTLGTETLEVISTPGHSKGSVCLLGDGFLITGDTLFSNSYGRYDLHGGNADELVSSLASLRSFDPKLTIYPGHGDSATLGDALNTIMYM